MPIEITKEEAGEVILITLGGDLTFPQIPRVKEALLEAFASSRHVGLEIKAVAEVDVSFLQVLCAAYRTALAEGKEITLLNWELPAPLREAARAAGFEGMSGCPAGCGCWFAARRPVVTNGAPSPER